MNQQTKTPLTVNICLVSASIVFAFVLLASLFEFLQLWFKPMTITAVLISALTVYAAVMMQKAKRWGLVLFTIIVGGFFLYNLYTLFPFSDVRIHAILPMLFLFALLSVLWIKDRKYFNR